MIKNHMQNLFGSGKDVNTRINTDPNETLGFAPILDPNASLVSDQTQSQAPSMDYMDVKFNNSQRDIVMGQSQHSMTDVVNSSPHLANLNKGTWDRLTEYSKRHIQKVVTEQLYMNELSCHKWEAKLTEFVLKAVEQVKPLSRMQGDFMDINSYIKVKIIDWKDNSKSSYVDGLVMSNSIASRRMQTVRTNPRVLLLRSIGQDEGRGSTHFMIPDLATKIDS